MMGANAFGWAYPAQAYAGNSEASAGGYTASADAREDSAISADARAGSSISEDA